MVTTEPHAVTINVTTTAVGPLGTRRALISSFRGSWLPTFDDFM
jgi:hypothetical protein